MAKKSSFRKKITGLFGKPKWRRAVERAKGKIAEADSRIGSLEARLAGVDAMLAGFDSTLIGVNATNADLVSKVQNLEGAWQQNVPSFLNAVGSVAALSHELAAYRKSSARTVEAHQTRLGNADNSIRALWQRIEFVRSEILFEMSHGAGQTGKSGGIESVEPAIVDEEKLAAARSEGNIRLNLGCGHIAMPNYLNVDARRLPGVDIVAEVGDLPFEPGSLEEIHSAHLLEHFPQEAMRRKFLPYWYKLLRSGGVFRAITPDAAAMLEAASAGTYPFEEFREVLFGGQDYDGDYHYNLFTPETLSALLREVGFVDIEVPVAGRRNGKCFEFEVVAHRP